MSKLSNRFNILKWTGKLAGSGLIAGAIVLSQQPDNVSPTDDFNIVANPDPGIAVLEVETDSGIKTYDQPDDIARVLANLGDDGSPAPRRSVRPAVRPDRNIARPSAHKDFNPDRSSPDYYLTAYRQSDPLTPVIDRLIMSESGGDPNAVSHTGARGLGQFVGGTFLEQLWFNRDLLPDSYDHITKNVERYVRKQTDAGPIYDWRVKKGYSEKRVMNLAHDPLVSQILAAEYARSMLEKARDDGYYRSELADKIGAMRRSGKYKDHKGRVRLTHMEQQLDRPFNAVDLKIMYVFGMGGGVKALVALADPAKAGHRAADYPPKHVVNANPDIFYKDGRAKKHPRSLSEMYQYFAERVGTRPIPRDISRDEIGFIVATKAAPKP